MARSRHIVGGLLMATLLASAWAPMLACILPAPGQAHGCCTPAAAVQPDRGQGTRTCCTVQRSEGPQLTSARYEGTPTLPVAALCSGAVFGSTGDGSMTTSSSDVSPPGALPSHTSVLRI